MSNITKRIEDLENRIMPAEEPTAGPIRVVCVEFYKDDPGVAEMVAQAETEAAALPPSGLGFNLVLIEKSRKAAVCSG